MNDRKINEQQQELRLSVASLMSALSYCLLVLMFAVGVGSIYLWVCGFLADIPGTMYCDYTVTWKDYMETGLGPMLIGLASSLLAMGILRLACTCMAVRDALIKETDEVIPDTKVTTK